MIEVCFWKCFECIWNSIMILLIIRAISQWVERQRLVYLDSTHLLSKNAPIICFLIGLLARAGMRSKSSLLQCDKRKLFTKKQTPLYRHVLTILSVIYGEYLYLKVNCLTWYVQHMFPVSFWKGRNLWSMASCMPLWQLHVCVYTWMTVCVQYVSAQHVPGASTYCICPMCLRLH